MGGRHMLWLPGTCVNSQERRKRVYPLVSSVLVLLASLVGAQSLRRSQPPRVYKHAHPLSVKNGKKKNYRGEPQEGGVRCESGKMAIPTNATSCPWPRTQKPCTAVISTSCIILSYFMLRCGGGARYSYPSTRTANRWTGKTCTKVRYIRRALLASALRLLRC